MPSLPFGAEDERESTADRASLELSAYSPGFSGAVGIYDDETNEVTRSVEFVPEEESQNAGQYEEKPRKSKRKSHKKSRKLASINENAAVDFEDEEAKQEKKKKKKSKRKKKRKHRDPKDAHGTLSQSIEIDTLPDPPSREEDAEESIPYASNEIADHNDTRVLVAVAEGDTSVELVGQEGGEEDAVQYMAVKSDEGEEGARSLTEEEQEDTSDQLSEGESEGSQSDVEEQVTYDHRSLRGADSTVSDITDDVDARFEIARMAFMRKQASLKQSRRSISTPSDFDKWETLVEMDPNQQTGWSNRKQWDETSSEFLNQPKKSTLSDADKWEHFTVRSAGISSEDQPEDLIAKWKKCFESDSVGSPPGIPQHQEAAPRQRLAPPGTSDSIHNRTAPPPATTETCSLPRGSESAAAIRHRANYCAPPPVNAGGRPYRMGSLVGGNERPQELLAMYLESMGTDPLVAREVAETFAQRSAIELEGCDEYSDVEGRRPNPMSIAEYYDLVNDTKAAMELREYDKYELGVYAKQQSSKHRDVVANIDAVGDKRAASSREGTVSSSISVAGTTSTAARRRHLWRHFENPGAIQMDGRAFGAPVRETPEVGEGDVEDPTATEESSSRELVLEATAVHDHERDAEAPERRSRSSMPVVYAEQLSFTSWAKEHKFFRRTVIVIVLAGAAVVASVLAFRLSGRNSNSDGTSDSPTAAPTFISNDFVEELESVSGYEALSTPGSPQRRAVGWLSSIDQSGVEARDSSLLQRYVLVVLYFATEGDQWLERENWLDPTMHECQWGSSILCKTDPSSRQIVTGLDLSRHGLTGELPPEVGYLDQIEHFVMARNSLSGRLPSSVFNMTRLAVLDLQGNDFSGLIPSTISNAPFIVHLDLSMNLFGGSIPEALYDLSILRMLDVSVNQITGVLASGLGKLAALTTFNIRSNLITGPIPDTFDLLPDLVVIQLDNNVLTGNIPEWTGQLAQRHELTVSHNLLTGTIPGVPEGGIAALGGVSPESFRLSRLDMSSNRLVGTIPPEAGLVPSIRHIDFSNNQLVGTFPAFPGMWKNIEYLAASNCQLTGTVPKDFSDSLTHFIFHGNNFHGGLPEDLCDKPALKYLSLAFNDLGGTIPPKLGSMEHLEAFDLRACGFVGTMPSLVNMTSLARIDLAENSLGGSLSSEIGGLSTLTELIAHSNRLTGTLPTEFGRLSNLVILDIRENFITGSLPTELGLMTDLDEFLVANNHLEGSVPEGVCDHVDDLRLVDVGCQLECDCCADGTGLCP